jgi:hypothetical protein
MKSTSVAKAVEKAGGEVRSYGSHRVAVVNGFQISWYDQEGDAIALHTKRDTEQNDPNSDYYPGSFWKSIKSALEFGCELKKKAIGEAVYRGFVESRRPICAI